MKTVKLFGILVRVPPIVVPPPALPAPPPPPAAVGAQLRELLIATCEAFGYTYQELTGPVRSKMIVSARREFARVARERGYSLPEIGRALRRHHTTILSLLRKA